MTIRFEDVWMRYKGRGGSTWTARGITHTFPGGRSVALLGRNGAGKSTLLRLIAGVVRPSAGRIVRQGTVSWPVGFAGSFHPDLTGRQNTRFVARLYGAEAGALLHFVEAFTGLGRDLDRPLRGYSSGMRARLAFGLSMGLPFDTYLVDEVTSVGDGAFRARSEALLAQRLETSGAIIVSHSLQHLARLCMSGAVLENGTLTWYDDVMEAIEAHRRIMGTPEAHRVGGG